MKPYLTAEALRIYIGRVVGLRDARSKDNSILFEVRVMDVKVGWQHPRLLIVPLAGSGEKWVQLSRLKLDAPPVHKQRTGGGKPYHKVKEKTVEELVIPPAPKEW